jgi:hypothetical protein
VLVLVLVPVPVQVPVPVHAGLGVHAALPGQQAQSEHQLPLAQVNRRPQRARLRTWGFPAETYHGVAGSW